MTKSRALALINAVAMGVMAVAFIGLSVLHAGGGELALAVLLPASIASHLCSRVVMHYGAAGRDRRLPR